MGLRGPAKKPTPIRKLEGKPGHRPLNEREPQPGVFRAKPPAKVRNDPAALKAWNEMVPKLRACHVLTELDAIALGNICIDVALLDKVTGELAKVGVLIENRKTGMWHQNPLVHMVGSIAERVHRHLRDFGMTPSGRTSLSVDLADKDSNPWAALL